MTKSWDTYKNIIVDLYADRTLAEVRQIMQRDYGFDASTRAYRGRLIRWGVRKYNTRRADGSASDDEDGEGTSSPSDPDSPRQGRQPRNHEVEYESPPQHHYSHDGGQGRGLASAALPLDGQSPVYSSYIPDDDDTQSPYINGYPTVSRAATTQPPYNIWSPPDNDAFPPAHSQPSNQVPYSASYYPTHGSTAFPQYDSDLYHPPPHSAGTDSYDPMAYAYQGVGEVPESEYSQEHYHPSHGNTFGHNEHYAIYNRHQSQYAGAARRGHRERGRG